MAVFSELFYPHGGGAELATWLYLKLLSEEEGIKIKVVTRQFPGEPSTELVNKNLTIFRIPMKIALGSRYDTLVNMGILLKDFNQKLIKESDVVYIPGCWYSAIPIAKMHKNQLLPIYIITPLHALHP